MNSIKNASLSGVAVAIFIFFLPFVDSTKVLYGAINSKYFFVVGFTTLLGLYFSYLVFRDKHTISLKNRGFLFLGIIVLGVYYLSALLGVDSMRSLWSDILRSTGLFFLTSVGLLALFLGELLTKKDWSLVRKSIATSGAIFAFLTFFGPGGFSLFEAKARGLFVFGTRAGDFLDPGGFLSTGTVEGLTFGNSTFAGIYLLISFIVTLVEVFNNRGAKRKIFSVLAIAHLFSPLLLNLKALVLDPASIISNPIIILGKARSSGATIILLLIYLVGFYLVHRFSKSYKKYMLPAWIAGFMITISVFVSLLFIPGTVVQEKYIESSTAARLILWSEGVEAIQERPLLGFGPENFRFAHERYFDNRLHLEENIGEVWFDRAHNVLVDTLVSVGVLGFLATMLLLVYFAFIFYRAQKRNLISLHEANLFGILVFFHLLQLQTSFDTPATYAIWGVLFGYALWLEKEMISKNRGENFFAKNQHLQKGVAVFMIIFILFSASEIFAKELSRQRAAMGIFSAANKEEQSVLINRALSDKNDFETLRLTSNSLVNGALTQIGEAKASERASIQETVIEQLSLYEGYYLEYLERSPEDYRVRMNYAHLLLTKTVLGEDRVGEAKTIIEDSYDLSSGNPLTYIMDSLASLYGGGLPRARELIKEGVEINPDIELSRDTAQYIEEQAKRFPNIAVLKLENL